MVKRARSSTGAPFGATSPSATRLSTAVRAGHAALDQGVSTRRTAIDAYAGSNAANPTTNPMHAIAPNARSAVGRNRSTPLKLMPRARSSRFLTAYAASSFVRATPVSSKSTAAARCPASSGRWRSIRCAISMGLGRNRNAGTRNLRTSTATRTTIASRIAARIGAGNRTSASIAAVPDTAATTRITSAPHAATIRSALARTARRSTASTATERAPP